MLKLKVMQLISTLVLYFVFSQIWLSIFPQLDLVRISSPSNGDNIQGIVQIIGTVTGNDLSRVEVSFRYQDSDSQSWFLIDQVENSVVDAGIATWDTSTIADGTYQLRVLAIYGDGRNQQTIIENLHVRNYTPFDPVKTGEQQIEQIQSTNFQIPEESISPTMKSTPSPMPPNEMIISENEFMKTAFLGAILGILFLFVLILFIIIRNRKLG